MCSIFVQTNAAAQWLNSVRLPLAGRSSLHASIHWICTFQSQILQFFMRIE